MKLIKILILIQFCHYAVADNAHKQLCEEALMSEAQSGNPFGILYTIYGDFNGTQASFEEDSRVDFPLLNDTAIFSFRPIRYAEFPEETARSIFYFYPLVPDDLRSSLLSDLKKDVGKLRPVLEHINLASPQQSELPKFAKRHKPSKALLPPGGHNRQVLFQFLEQFKVDTDLNDEPPQTFQSRILKLHEQGRFRLLPPLDSPNDIMRSAWEASLLNAKARKGTLGAAKNSLAPYAAKSYFPVSWDSQKIFTAIWTVIEDPNSRLFYDSQNSSNERTWSFVGEYEGVTLMLMGTGIKIGTAFPFWTQADDLKDYQVLRNYREAIKAILKISLKEEILTFDEEMRVLEHNGIDTRQFIENPSDWLDSIIPFYVKLYFQKLEVPEGLKAKISVLSFKGDVAQRSPGGAAYNIFLYLHYRKLLLGAGFPLAEHSTAPEKRK